MVAARPFENQFINNDDDEHHVEEVQGTEEEVQGTEEEELTPYEDFMSYFLDLPMNLIISYINSIKVEINSKINELTPESRVIVEDIINSMDRSYMSRLSSRLISIYLPLPRLPSIWNGEEWIVQMSITEKFWELDDDYELAFKLKTLFDNTIDIGIDWFSLIEIESTVNTNKPSLRHIMIENGIGNTH